MYDMKLMHLIARLPVNCANVHLRGLRGNRNVRGVWILCAKSAYGGKHNYRKTISPRNRDR